MAGKAKAVLFLKAGEVTKAETREALVLFDPLGLQKSLHVDRSHRRLVQ